MGPVDQNLPSADHLISQGSTRQPHLARLQPGDQRHGTDQGLATQQTRQMVWDRVVDPGLDFAREFQHPARSMRPGLIDGSMKHVVIQNSCIPLGKRSLTHEMRLRFRHAWPLKPTLSADGARRKPTNQRDLFGDLNDSCLPSTDDGRIQQNDATR
jgi:hypothetical protein